MDEHSEFLIKDKSEKVMRDISIYILVYIFKTTDFHGLHSSDKHTFSFETNNHIHANSTYHRETVCGFS